MTILGNTSPENFKLTDGEPVNGRMTTLNIVGTDAASGNLDTDYEILNASAALGDTLTLNGGTGPNIIDASQLGGPPNTAFLANSVEYPQLENLTLIGGTVGGNTIIASPFNDVLNTGPGPNNTVVIQRGLYTFVGPTTPVNETLVVNTDADVALYNNTVIMGVLLQDTGSTLYGVGENFPSEATIANAAATQNGASYPADQPRSRVPGRRDGGEDQ